MAWAERARSPTAASRLSKDQFSIHSNSFRNPLSTADEWEGVYMGLSTQCQEREAEQATRKYQSGKEWRLQRVRFWGERDGTSNLLFKTPPSIVPSHFLARTAACSVLLSAIRDPVIWNPVERKKFQELVSCSRSQEGRRTHVLLDIARRVSSSNHTSSTCSQEPVQDQINSSVSRERREHTRDEKGWGDEPALPPSFWACWLEEK